MPIVRRSLAVAGAAVMLSLGSIAMAQMSNAPAPGPGFFPSTAKGKKLFTEKCAVCHGADLRGTDKGPPMLHPVYRPDHHSDVAFQLAVKNGSKQHHWRFGDMAPVPGLTPDDVGHITAFVRQEQRQAKVF
jgi:cytochrome c